MTREHPTPDLLDHYLINDLSEPETAELERHVFACDSCFARVKSRELESIALAKACMMLAKLENDGTRVLTISALEPDPIRMPFRQVMPTRRFQPQYALIATTAAMVIMTVASLETVSTKTTASAVPPAEAPVSESVQARVSFDEALIVSTEQPPPMPRRKARSVRAEYTTPVRYTRPFLPPNGDVEAPEFDMTHVPPPVYAARRFDAPAGLMRLPDAPKKRVRRSRGVFSALVSPFKKVGGAVAVLFVGDNRSGI